MSGFTTWLVLPAVTDMAGQLRVVSRTARGTLGLSDYRANPDGWAEAGLITAGSGRVVCLDAPTDVFEEFRDCEPIRPPLVVTRPIAET